MRFPSPKATNIIVQRESLGNAIKQNPSLKATNKMPQSLFKFLAHTVFSTKNRVDLIAPEIENDLFGYIHGIVENNDAKLIIANGTANHVHLLVYLPRKIDVSELIGEREARQFSLDKKAKCEVW